MRRRSVLRRYLLIARNGCLLLRRSRRLLVALTEQTTKEAGGVRRLRTLLLNLLLKLAELGPGLIEGDVLHENRLREHVEGVRISGEALVQKGLCVRVFFLERRLVEAIDEGIKKLIFLGSHDSKPPAELLVASGPLS